VCVSERILDELAKTAFICSQYFIRMRNEPLSVAMGNSKTRLATRSEMYFAGLHPAEEIPLRPCNTLGVFSPLAPGRNLEQIPHHLVSGASEPMQVMGRQAVAKI